MAKNRKHELVGRESKLERVIVAQNLLFATAAATVSGLRGFVEYRKRCDLDTKSPIAS